MSSNPSDICEECGYDGKTDDPSGTCAVCEEIEEAEQDDIDQDPEGPFAPI